MKFMVVFFALCAVVCLADAQTKKRPALLATLNPRRGKRSLEHYVAPAAVAHAPVVAAVPSAVSHQSRVDVRSSPAVVAHAAVVPAVAPVGYAAPYNYGYGYAAPYNYGSGHAAAPYNYGYGYYSSAPWALGW